MDIEVARLLSDMNQIKRSLVEKDVFPQAINLDSQTQGTENERGSFSEILEKSVNKVNDLQQASSNLKMAFEKGEEGVDIVKVMVASEKAGIATQAMIQVRNKFIDAYRDIMNMSI